MADILPFKPNSRTATRLRLQREATKQRLINQIGINQHDAPLYDEYLQFLAYMDALTNIKVDKD